MSLGSMTAVSSEPDSKRVGLRILGGVRDENLGIRSWGTRLVVPPLDWPRAFHEFHIHLSETGNDFVNNDEAFPQ